MFSNIRLLVNVYACKLSIMTDHNYGSKPTTSFCEKCGDIVKDTKFFFKT